MPHYLTNTALSNEARCIEAARRSGFDVRFERQPMPSYANRFCMILNDDEEDAAYDRIRPSLVGEYGCVVSYEGYRDHEPFWREWDALA